MGFMQEETETFHMETVSFFYINMVSFLNGHGFLFNMVFQISE